MIISDLNYLESVEAQIEGGTYGFSETDTVSINFNTTNNFATNVNSPYTLSNSAAAGAKGVANNYTYLPTYSYTKADTLAVADFLGGSFSGSTSVAVINKACGYC
ncbi:MAG: hypothetical protein B0A82_01210 [Alkalinema sp. CACIAM 70d]|nr:MAG: hypothetical protein B0A82_01210 [Alkalinema sp. CACIAM 70d]